MAISETYPTNEIHKIRKALETYYSRFNANSTYTLQSAVEESGTIYGYVHDYMMKNKLGMPSNRKEALTFLKKLRNLK